MTYFIQACKRGDLALAQQIYIEKIDDYISVNSRTAFTRACKNNHIHVVQWMYDTFPGIVHIQHDFQKFCTSRHMRIIKWLHDNYKNIDKTIYYPAFKSCCKRGETDVAEWMLQIYDLSMIKAKLVHQCCTNTHPWIVKLLLEYDVFCNINRDYAALLLTSCEQGNLLIAKYLVEHKNTCVIMGQPFLRACFYGHLEIVKWLVENFEIAFHEPNIEHKDAIIMGLHQACHGNQLCIVKW